MIDRTKKISFGHIQMDKDLKTGLILLILLFIFGLLIRNLISELIEKIFLFLIIFSVVFLITHNWIISLLLGSVLYLVLAEIRKMTMGIEKFQNEKEEEEVAKINEEEESADDEKIDLKKLAKMEKTNKNIEETPITKEEVKDMDYNKAAAGLNEFAKKLNGGIKLKEDDIKETLAFGMDFKNSKYKKNDKKSPLQKAQIETYELMNTIQNLEKTIEHMSPILNQGKKIMDMYESFKI